MKRLVCLVLFATACSGYDGGSEGDAALLQWGDREVGPNDTERAAEPEVIAVEWSHGPLGSEKQLIWSDGTVSDAEHPRRPEAPPESTSALGQLGQAVLRSQVTDNTEFTMCDRDIDAFRGDFLQAVGFVQSSGGELDITSSFGDCEDTTDAAALTVNQEGVCDASCNNTPCPGSNSCTFAATRCEGFVGKLSTCTIRLFPDTISEFVASYIPTPPPNGDLAHAIARKTWLHELGHALGLDHDDSVPFSLDTVMPSFAYPPWGQPVSAGSFNDQLAHVNRFSFTEIDELELAITPGDEL